MTKLNIGIIGSGMVAQEHIKNIKKIKHARVAWLADLDTKLLGSVLKKYKIPNGTNDYRRLLDWGVYDLSFHLGVLSDTPELVSVKSFTCNQLDRKDPGTEIFDVEEHAVSMMEFSGGLRYYWERGSHANVDVPNETRIYGSKGGMKFGYLSWDPVAVEYFYTTKEGGGKAKSKTIPVKFDKHLDDNFELTKHFVDIVLNGKEAVMPLSLEAKHLRILFEVYKASI